MPQCHSLFYNLQAQNIDLSEQNILKDVRVKLDLKKKKYNVLKSARSIADEKQGVNYVFADITCRLKVVFKDRTSEFFKDIADSNLLIEQRMP